MKILDTITQDLTQELNSLDFTLNKDGWFRDKGWRFEKRFGISYQGDKYREIVTKDFEDATLTEIEPFPAWLSKLRDKYYPEADACSIYKAKIPEYSTSTSWHKDEGLFEDKVITINFGEAIFEIYREDKVQLKQGDVLEFDSSKLHSSTQVSDERTVIIFRKVK